LSTETYLDMINALSDGQAYNWHIVSSEFDIYEYELWIVLNHIRQKKQKYYSKHYKEVD
jgi:hypothetical protein